MLDDGGEQREVGLQLDVVLEEAHVAPDARELLKFTGISSEIRTKLRDWAVWQARAGCYFQAALSSNDSKTLYNGTMYN